MSLDTAFSGDIFARLVDEHRRILELFEAASDDPAAFRALVRAVRLHDRAEDETLFRVLDKSYELGRHMRLDHQDHAVIESLLHRIQPGGDLIRLRDALLRHFADEEQVVFPAAHQVVSAPHAAELLHLYEMERAYLESRIAL
jgi:hemerythrin-like domain-containing protein